MNDIKSEHAKILATVGKTNYGVYVAWDAEGTAEISFHAVNTEALEGSTRDNPTPRKLAFTPHPDQADVAWPVGQTIRVKAK